MQINPLFINTAEVPTPGGETKNFRLDNCSYLFSDIIKVELDENSEATVDQNNTLTENPLVVTVGINSSNSISESVNLLFEEGNQIISGTVDLVDGVTVSELLTNFDEISLPIQASEIVAPSSVLIKNEKEILENLFKQLENLVKEKLSIAEETSEDGVVGNLQVASRGNVPGDPIIVSDLFQIIKPLFEEVKSNHQSYPTVNKIELVSKDKEIEVTDIQDNILGGILEESLLKNEKVSLVFTTTGGTVALEISIDILTNPVEEYPNAEGINSTPTSLHQDVDKEVLSGVKPSTIFSDNSLSQSHDLNSSKNESNSINNAAAIGFDQKIIDENKTDNASTNNNSVKQNNLNSSFPDATASSVKTENIASPNITNDSKVEQSENLHIKTTSSIKESSISVTGNINVIETDVVSDKTVNLKNTENQVKSESEVPANEESIKSDTVPNTSGKINIDKVDPDNVKNENISFHNSNNQSSKSELTPEITDVLKKQVHQSFANETVSKQSESSKPIISTPESQSIENKINIDPNVKSTTIQAAQTSLETSKLGSPQSGVNVSAGNDIDSDKQIVTASDVQSIKYKVTEDISENSIKQQTVNQVVYKVVVKNPEVQLEADKSTTSEDLLRNNHDVQTKPNTDIAANVGNQKTVSPKVSLEIDGKLENPKEVVNETTAQKLTLSEVFLGKNTNTETKLNNLISAKVVNHATEPTKVSLEVDDKLNNSQVVVKETTKEQLKTYQIKLVETFKSVSNEFVSKPETITEPPHIQNDKLNTLTKSQVLKMFSSPFIKFENPTEYRSVNVAELKENQLPLETIDMKQTLDLKLGQESILYHKQSNEISTSSLVNDIASLSTNDRSIMNEAATKLDSTKPTVEATIPKPIQMSESKISNLNSTVINNTNVKTENIISELKGLRDAIKPLGEKTDSLKFEKPITNSSPSTQQEADSKVFTKTSVEDKRDVLYVSKNISKLASEVSEQNPVKLGEEKVKSLDSQKASVQREESVPFNKNKETSTKLTSVKETEQKANSNNINEIVKEVIKSVPEKDSTPKPIMVNEREAVSQKETKVELTLDKSASTVTNVSENSDKNETKNQQEKESTRDTSKVESEAKHGKEAPQFKLGEEMKERGISETVKMSNNIKTVRTTEIVKEIQNIIQSGEKQSVTMKLTPATFGSVKVLLETVNNVLTAKIEVENDTVKQIVQSNIEQLKHSLNENGIQLATINISLSNHDQRSPRSQFMKKKGNSSGSEKKVDTESGAEIKPKKQYGYNTYEYLA